MSIDARTRIGEVRLTAADLDRALAFYTGTLGFRLRAATATPRRSPPTAARRSCD